MSDARTSISAGTFRNSPRLSLAADIGISATRDAAFSGASDVALQVAGNISDGDAAFSNIDMTSVAFSTASGAPGGIVQATHDHNGFSAAIGNGDLTGTPSTSGDLGGVTSDFSGDGGSIDTGDGTSTSISGPSGDSSPAPDVSTGGSTETPSSSSGGPASDTPSMPDFSSSADPASPSTPDVSAPDASPAPDTSSPDVSTPDVSAPDVSTPDVSTPDVSTPDVSGGPSSGDAPSPGSDASPSASPTASEGQAQPALSNDSFPDSPARESADQTASTNLSDGSNVSTHFDADGNVTGTDRTSVAEDGSGGHQISADHTSGTTTVNTETRGDTAINAPNEVTSTTVTDTGATTHTGHGDITVDTSSPDGPGVQYDHAPGPDGDGGFSTDLSQQGQAVVDSGQGPATTATATGDGFTVTHGDGGGTVDVSSDGGSVSLDGGDAHPGIGRNGSDGSVTVDAGDAPVSATPKPGGGSEIGGGNGPRVDVPADADAPVTVTGDADQTTVLQAGGGATAALGAAGAAHATSVQTPNGATTSVGQGGHRVQSPDGTTHNYNADSGGLTVSNDNGSASVNEGGVRVQQDSSLPGHTTDLQITMTPDGPQGNGVAAGTRIDPSGDGGTTYTNTQYDANHQAVNTSTATGNPDGSVTAGATTASPDGTVSHPDFTLNPDGTLSVPDGQGGRHEYGADGTPQRTVHPDGSVSVPDGQGGALHYDSSGYPTPDTHPAPPSLGAGPDGSPVFTASDGTVVRPGDGAMSPEGWILRPTDGGVSLTAPPNRSGDTLTVTHGADGSLTMDSGGFQAQAAPDGTTSASTSDGLQVGQNDNGRHASDDHYISTVSPDGHASTHDVAAPDGPPVAEHADGQGTAHLPDGTSVHDDGGPGRVEVPPGQRTTIDTGDASISVSESGTATVRGGLPHQDGSPASGADPWSVSGGRDGTVNAHTPTSDITSHPDGRVEFANGDFSGTVDADDTTVTDRTDGMEYRPTSDGVEVSRGEDGATVHVGQDSSSISEPGGDTPHNVAYDGDGRPATVEVRPDGPTSLDLHADGHVDVNGPKGETTRVEPGSFETTGDRSHVVADGDSTQIENKPKVGNGSTITHGGEGDGVVSVDHNGYEHTFTGDGPVSQTPSGGASGNGPTRPSLERDGTVSTVEQTYSLPGGQREIPGPSMGRDTDSGVTEVSHDGFSATQSDGSNGGRDITVRPSEDGPVVTRRDDGSTTVEGESLRVDRSPEAADESGRQDPSRRDLTIDTTGDGSGPTVTRDPDGNITVSDGDGPVLTQPNGERPTAPDGGSDNVRVQQDGNRTVVEHTSPQTGRQTVVEIRSDGRIDVTSGNDHVSVNRNGTPTSTFSDGSGHTTKVEEKNDDSLQITDREQVDGSTQHTTVNVDENNAVSVLDIKPKKTTEAQVAESWRMGIDSDGQASTVNNRPYDDPPVTLTPDGNLQQGVADLPRHTSMDQDWGQILRDMRLEMIKGFANGGFDIAQKLAYSFWADEDFEESTLVTAGAQVFTAAPRGIAESVHANDSVLPGGRLGNLGTGQFNELAHQQMRNNVSDAAQDQFGLSDSSVQEGVSDDEENVDENGYSVRVDGEEGTVLSGQEGK